MKLNLNKIKKETTNALYKLLRTSDSRATVSVKVKCLDLYNNFRPDKGDEVVTYRYIFKLEIEDEQFLYDGWCYEDDLDKIAVGIYSHWLLKNYKIYKGGSTAWYKMYVGIGNIDKKK